MCNGNMHSFKVGISLSYIFNFYNLSFMRKYVFSFFPLLLAIIGQSQNPLRGDSTIVFNSAYINVEFEPVGQFKSFQYSLEKLNDGRTGLLMFFTQNNWMADEKVPIDSISVKTSSGNFIVWDLPVTGKYFIKDNTGNVVSVTHWFNTGLLNVLKREEIVSLMLYSGKERIPILFNRKSSIEMRKQISTNF